MTDESPRIPPCDLCGHAQVEYGAVLVGPPREDGYAKKWHVCVSCWKCVCCTRNCTIKMKCWNNACVKGQPNFRKIIWKRFSR